MFTKLILILLSLVAQADEPLDFIFDIDLVLVEKVSSDNMKSDGATYLEVYGSFYELRLGAGEILESIAKIPGARISFFSSAQRVRNDILLKAWKLPSGQSAWDLANGRVFSSANLSDGKKDITPFARDSRRSFLIDDRKEFIFPGQEENFVWARNFELNDSEDGRANIERELKRAKPRIQVATRNFFQHHNQLIYIRGLIELALELSGTKAITLVSAMKQLQNSAARNGSLRLAAYRRGLSALKKENPSLKIRPVFSERATCASDLAWLHELLKVQD